jgi:NADPH:quinone reductase-like Zn-dependent oxidoreductase
MFATQLAIIGGATVFAQIRDKEQIPFLESLGPCTPILSANGESIEDWGPYRLVVDGVSGVILDSGIRSLSPDGICVCYGITSAPKISVDVRPFMFSGETKKWVLFILPSRKKSPKRRFKQAIELSI